MMGMRSMISASPSKKRTMAVKKESFGRELHQRGVMIGSMWIRYDNTGDGNS